MKEKIREAYDFIAEGFNEQIDHKPHNAFYDRPNMLNLLGPCKGKRILDVACGPGKYAEELIGRGAKVTGFDVSAEMIKHAKERNGKSGTFFVHDMEEPLVDFMDNTFDALVCALAFHYMENWDAALKEFYRVLKPNGRLVVSMEHPFYEYLYYKSDRYFDVEPVKCVWKGFDKPVEIHSFRRPLTLCIMPFLQNGFHINEILEPLPTSEFAIHDVKHFEELTKFPAFLCISASPKESKGI